MGSALAAMPPLSPMLASAPRCVTRICVNCRYPFRPPRSWWSSACGAPDGSKTAFESVKMAPILGSRDFRQVANRQILTTRP